MVCGLQGAVVRWGSVWVSECGGVLCGCHIAVDAVWMPRGTVGCLEATGVQGKPRTDVGLRLGCNGIQRVLLARVWSVTEYSGCCRPESGVLRNTVGAVRLSLGCNGIQRVL